MAGSAEVSEEPIGDALARRADIEESSDYTFRAMLAIREYLETRPAIDPGEDMTFLSEDLDKIFEEECEAAGRVLRRISIEPGQGPGGMDIVTEPFIPPSQRKETRT